MSTENTEKKETETTEEEKKEIDFRDPKEPIDSIEKTVEDLKKKIQELNDQEEEKAKEEEAKDDGVNIPSFVSEEQKARIREIKESTVRTVSDSIDNIREKAENAKNPDLARTVEYIKANAVKAIELAKVRIDEVRNDPKVQSAADKAGNSLKKVSAAAADQAKKAADYVDTHMDPKTKENLKNAADKAGQAVNEGTRKVVSGVNDFVNKPEVQDSIAKAKEKAADLADKGNKAVQNLLNRKDQD